MKYEFLNKLTDQLKRYTIEEYILYSLDLWMNYIKDLDIMNKNIVEYITDKENRQKIEEFTNENGILDLQYNQDQILKRHIIGFDYDISIRKTGDWTFQEYFIEYKEYLTKHPINNMLKFKLILQTITCKIDIVPRLAIFNTIENNVGEVGYNINYSNKISESLTVNMMEDISKELEILSNNRVDEKLLIIEQEITDIFNLLSEGLFSLIIHDRYPKTLENILPEEVYKKQIEDRILKNETTVKYDGKLYRSIRLEDSYVVLDSELHVETDLKRADTIYCKINLAKSMLR